MTSNILKEKIEKQLQSSLEEFDYPLSHPITLETPANREFGDYATNISFRLAKPLKQAPNKIAEEICAKLSASSTLKNNFSFNAVNGFINLSVSDQTLWDEFLRIGEEKPTFSIVSQKLLLEFVSANPTGPLHIGHGRWAIIGDVMGRLLSFVGHQVDREFYINDAGNQIKLFYDSVNAIKEGQYIPENGYHGDYITQLAQSKEDPLELNIKSQKEVLNKIGVAYTKWFSEKSIHEAGKVEATLEKLKKFGIAYESEGALWFKTTDYGDDKDRVLIKKDGDYTYFAVDLAYHLDKIERQYDQLINIFGADHHGYINRIQAGVAALSGQKERPKESDSKLRIIIGQLVTLIRGGEPVRMSKRTGEMITLNEVIDDIGADATRYFLCHKSADTHLQFDLELAKQKSAENPVYYIQYAHARICSLQAKCDPVSNDSIQGDITLDKEERALIFQCLQVYQEIFQSVQHMAPHKLCHYTHETARSFHHFYEVAPIIKADPNVQKKRLIILNQLKEVLLICGELIGIQMPNRM